MKKYILIFCFISIGLHIYAQDYLTGRMLGSDSGEKKIYYDRTQLTISPSVFQSVYKVLDQHKTLQYTITITHDQIKSSLYIAFKGGAAATRGSVVEYNKNASGLIFSDIGNVDTTFSMLKRYGYLISFTDTSRDYPVLHQIKTDNNVVLELDPLSRNRIKKHNELVRNIDPAILNPPDEAELYAKSQKGKKHNSANDNDLTPEFFNSMLFQIRDSLYKHNSTFTASIAATRSLIEKDISDLLKTNQVEKGETRYGGPKKGGKPEGKGILVQNGNIYDGVFKNGVFDYGIVTLHFDSSEYYGGLINDSMNGIGWLKYKNGGYLLGNFRNGKLMEGVVLNRDNPGEVFFGGYKNGLRNGYGELRGPNGSRYYGEFVDGRLVKGYSKEVDKFGYTSYAKMDNGAKESVEARQVEDFFNEILSFKK